MPSLRDKAIKSVFWVGSARSFGQIFSWIVTIYLVRKLSPTDFGLFAIGMVFISIIRILYDVNLGSAILQNKDITNKGVSTTFWFILILALLFYYLTWNCSSYVAAFFGNERIGIVIRIMGIGLLFQAFYLVPYWLLAKELDFNKRAKAEVFSSFLAQLTALSMAISGFGVWSLVMRFISREFFLAIFIYLLFPWKPQFHFSLRRLQPLLRFGLSVTGFAVFKYSYENIDRIIIGKLLGDTLLGYYSVAIHLSRMPIDKVITIINQVCFPVFSELQAESERLKRYFLQVTKLISLFAFPALIGGILVTEELVHLFLGVKWVPIIFVLQVLCAVTIPQTIVGTITALNNACGKPKINLIFSATLAVTLAGAILFGVKYELAGVAVAWLIVYPVVFLGMLYKSTKEIDLSLSAFFGNILHPIAACSVMAAVVALTKQYCIPSWGHLTSLIFLVLLGSGSYAGWFFVFSRGSFSEIASIGHSLGFGRWRLFSGRRNIVPEG